MDQKHSMMYPSLSGRVGEPSGANQDVGIPTEAPPSYDMAMATASSSITHNSQQQPSAPPPTTPVDVGQYPSPVASTPMVQASLIHYSQNVDTINRGLPPVVVEQPVSVGLEPMKLGPNPSTVNCPECGERRKTRMHHTANRRTHIFAIVLCLTGWCCCACCVPYCMSSCKTGHHYCAKCNAFLGTYSRNAF